MSDVTATVEGGAIATVDPGVKRRISGVNKSWKEARKLAAKSGISVQEARTQLARAKRGLPAMPITEAKPVESGMPAKLIDLNQKAQAFVKLAGSADTAKRLIDLCFPG